MKNRKLIRVIVIALGGVLIGIGIDGFLLGEGGSTDIISLISGGLLVLSVGLIILKS